MRASGALLSERQLRLIHQVKDSLPPHLRDRYLQFVADHLRGNPTDHAVSAAVNAAAHRVLAFANGDHRCA
jgi:hypothetical protein